MFKGSKESICFLGTNFLAFTFFLHFLSKLVFWPSWFLLMWFRAAWENNVLDLYWCANLIKSVLWSSLCSGILDELRINNCLRINSSTGIAGLWQQQKWHFLQSALSAQSVHFVLTASTASSSHSAGLSPFYVDVIFFNISISVSFLLEMLPAWQSVPAATQPSWPSASWKSFGGNLLLPTTQGASIQLPDHMLLLNLVCNSVL